MTAERPHYDSPPGHDGTPKQPGRAATGPRLDPERRNRWRVRSKHHPLDYATFGCRRHPRKASTAAARSAVWDRGTWDPGRQIPTKAA